MLVSDYLDQVIKSRPYKYSTKQSLIRDEILNEHFRWKDSIYQEDDLREDGTFTDWTPDIDLNDPSNDLFYA